jgi:alkanesulfonate monooxygenase SsuD/methylene tetrahydromethanopterin reductase-like flavin-dependent oxidoreductase (luciferase family)
MDHTFDTATDREAALAQSLNETREALVKMFFSGSPEEVVAKLEAELAAAPPPSPLYTDG